MTEPSITELLHALPDRVDPDPDFAAAMRAIVADELEAGRDVAPLELAQEVNDMTVSTPSELRAPRFAPRLLAAAAVVLVALVVATLFAIQSDDEAGIADDVESEGTTYVGGTLDSFDIDRPAPYRITTTADAIWTFTLEGTLVKRDPESLTPLAELSLSDSSIIAGSSDAVWVADAVSGDVLRIDAATAEVAATIPTGVEIVGDTFRWGRPGQAVGARGTYARIGWVAVAGDAVWVSDLDGRLLRIDPATNTIVDEIDVEIEGHFIHASADHVLLGDQTQERVQVVDANTGAVVADVDSFDEVAGAALHGGRAYVLDSTDPDAGTFGAPAVVTVIDLATGAEVVSASVGTLRRSAPDAPVFSPSIVVGAAGIVVPTDRELVVLDLESLEVLERREAPARTGSSTLGDAGAVWVASVNDAVVHRLRPTTR